MKPNATFLTKLGVTIFACLAVACTRSPRGEVEPLPGTPEAEAAGRLSAGAAALDIGNFSAARTDLGWVYMHCPGTDDGRTALLLMATGYLDPRNAERRPDLAAALAAHVADLAPSGSPLGSTATGIYLLAKEHGAPPPRAEPLEEARRDTRAAAAGCSAEEPRASLALLESAVPGDEATDGPIDWLPDLPSATVPDRIAAAEGTRDSLALRVAELEEQVQALRDRVEIQQQELERIRRTLRP
jgi:hypothetical protein